MPPTIVAIAAVAIAAVALFFLPALLGIGNPPGTGVTATPTPTAPVAASGTPAPPTPTPGPTQQIYVVQAGDTLSGIALKFNVPYGMLRDANLVTVPNPDVLNIGQEVIIPSVAPTSLPDAGPSASP